jgi:hypothetical protein
VALGQVFSEYFGFPCRFSFHQTLHTHLSSGADTVDQLVADLSWALSHTPPQEIKNKKFWKELTDYFPSYDTGHTENDASSNSSIVACVFVTAVTCLSRRCLASIGGFLPSRCLATTEGYTDTHTHTNTTATWSHEPTFLNKESRLKSTQWACRKHTCGLLFDPEYGSKTFFRNVGELLPDCRASNSRR